MIRIASLVLLLLAPALAAQATPATAGAPDPASLARLVVERFATGSAEAFDSVYPEAEARQMVRTAVQRGWARTPGQARVLSVDGDRAALLLTGTLTVGHSADETVLSRYFSGIYEAARSGGEWRLTRKLPLEGASRIAAQTLHVRLRPGDGLDVVDTMDVRVAGADGLAVRLNHRARVDDVSVDGRPLDHTFGGGVLWMAAPPGEHRVRLAYRLQVERDTSSTESGFFHPDYGHLRNAYFWHPFFDFGAAADRARFTVTVRAPAAYRVATTLPQASDVRGDERITVGRGTVPTATLSLLYDRDWQPAVADVGGVRLETLTTPRFRPGGDTMQATAARVVRLFRAHFGEPASTHLYVAEARGQGGGGFSMRNNDLVLAGRGGGPVGGGGAEPYANFAHEISHGWLWGTGPGANFINEGFATMAEALAVRELYGAEAERVFWERARNRYHLRGHEGRMSIVGERFGNLISYTRGAWVWRMLRDVMGAEAFRTGLLAFRSIPVGQSAGVEELAAAMSAAAGRDLGPFLGPWLEETTIPDVRARLEDGRVIVTQHGPLFHLPLELEVTGANGPVRMRMDLRAREDSLDVREVPRAVSVRLDPDHRLLIRRHWGGTARFELDAPEATRVQVAGDWDRQPVEAARKDGTGPWVAEVPLTEGAYPFWWIVDGRARSPGGDGKPGLHLVRPVQPMENAYPR